MDDGMEIVNIKSVVCVYCGLAIGHDIAPTEAGVAAIRDLMCKHDAVCESNPLVAHIATLERDLAAAQAEVVEARAALGKCACLPECSGGYSDDGSVFPCVRCNLLSCPPGSLSALEAWATEFGLKVAQVAASRGYQEGRAFRPEKVDMPAIVREELSRILGKEAAR